MKLQTLTYEQVLTRINSFYHEDFCELYESLALKNETILWAGNYTDYEVKPGYDYWRLGFVLITANRLIKFTFTTEFGVFGRREKITGNNLAFGVGLPTFPLSSNERKTKGVYEISLSNIYNVSRRDDKIKHHGKEMTIVGLWIETFGHNFKLNLYNREDGQEMYDILDSVVHHQSPKSPSIPDITDQLMKLAELRKSAMITDEEYEIAKRKLLSR